MPDRRIRRPARRASGKEPRWPKATAATASATNGPRSTAPRLGRLPAPRAEHDPAGQDRPRPGPGRRAGRVPQAGRQPARPARASRPRSSATTWSGSSSRRSSKVGRPCPASTTVSNAQIVADAVLSRMTSGPGSIRHWRRREAFEQTSSISESEMSPGCWGRMPRQASIYRCTTAPEATLETSISRKKFPARSLSSQSQPLTMVGESLADIHQRDVRGSAIGMGLNARRFRSVEWASASPWIPVHDRAPARHGVHSAVGLGGTVTDVAVPP